MGAPTPPTALPLPLPLARLALEPLIAAVLLAPTLEPLAALEPLTAAALEALEPLAAAPPLVLKPIEADTLSPPCARPCV